MSSQDFNNGLITGLAMKGIPYGVAQSWQPESISNYDTESIIIDFGRYIPEVEVESYINALYFTATYIEDQFIVAILGWERINDTTIKFLTTNYFSCNGIVNILYNTKQGNLDALPSFVVNYEPDGVPVIRYYKYTIDDLDIQTPEQLHYDINETNTNILIVPVLSNPIENISGQELTEMYPVSLDYKISEGSVQTTFE